MNAEKLNGETASPVVIVFVVSCVQFLTPFLSSSVGIALPTIGGEFGASASELGLIQMCYILAMTTLMLPFGRFSDIHGRKKIFLLGLILSIISTLALGLAENTHEFIFFRVVQGVGAAMIMTTSISIIASGIPREHNGRAMGIVAGMAYFGLAFGPVIGGTIVTNLGWRWLFFLIIPVQLLAVLLTLVKLKGEWVEARGERFDWLGSITYLLSLSIMIIGFTSLSRLDYAWLLTILGFVGFLFFLKIELKQEQPLLDVRLLIENKKFTISNIATFINYSAAFGFIFLFTLYLQFVKGLNAQQAGLFMMIQPCIQAVISPIAGRLADKYNPENLATFGMVICAIGLLASTHVGPETSWTVIISLMAILGTGFGLFASPNMKAILGSVAPRHFGTASSVAATMRMGGILASSAIITMILALYLGTSTITIETRMAFVHSMSVCLVIFTAMSVLAVVITLINKIKHRHEQPIIDVPLCRSQKEERL